MQAICCSWSLFLAGLAVIPLLSPAVFRCYFAFARLKTSGFLRPTEALPLYFPGIISGISERRGRDRGSAGAAPDRHLQHPRHTGGRPVSTVPLHERLRGRPRPASRNQVRGLKVHGATISDDKSRFDRAKFEIETPGLAALQSKRESRC